MDDIQLVAPSKEMELQAEQYRKEHLAHGESDLHGGSLLEKYASYDQWLAHLENNSREATVEPGWVVSSTFFAVRKSDGKLIGMVDIRHALNDFLASYGGHIGYGVRPTERRRGYAAQILKLALDYCASIGLERVMLACYRENPASSRTIVGGGGKLEREFTHSDGKVVQVFWIALQPSALPQAS